MKENKTAFAFDEYDAKICRTIPFYRDIHQQVIDLVNTQKKEDMMWLDTGCGTGTMAALAANACSVSKFLLCDPSERMLSQAKTKLKDTEINKDFLVKSSQELDYTEQFDVVTAILSHHYLNRSQREKATINCCGALKQGGMYITIENIAPLSAEGTALGLKRWEQYQVNGGKPLKEAQAHIARYGVEYFPIPLTEHLNLLKNCGFRYAEVFWVSYMQAGLYAVK